MSTRVLQPLLILSLLLFTGSQSSGGTLDDAKIALHVQSAVPPSKACSQSPATQGLPCSQFVAEADVGASYTIYLMVSHVNPTVGVGGVSCGIEYDPIVGQGIDVLRWTRCGDGWQFPNSMWPASGGGNRIGFYPCPVVDPVPGFEDEGASLLVGAFYVYAYSADTFAITENRFIRPPELQVLDCGASVSDLPLSAAGFAKFSPGAADGGCNPCVGPCDQDSVCLVVPSAVVIDTPASGTGEESFDIQNVSDEVITGDVRLPEDCTLFNITSGGGPFALQPEQSRTITVQYQADGCPPGGEACFLETGNGECGRVQLLGIVSGYSCDISQTEIDFGEVMIGESAERTVTILNDGCSTFDFHLIVECGEFAIVGGENLVHTPGSPDGEWRAILSRGETVTVDVVFSPSMNGVQECPLILLGSQFDCGPVLLAGTGVGALEPFLDLHPGSCVNPLNPVKKGVLPVSLLGSADFDVSLVDPQSVRLEGVRPKKVSVEDTSTPPNEPCQCMEMGPDGYDDLILKFLAQDVFEAVGAVVSGESVVLTLTGQLFDGTFIEAVDCMTVVGFAPEPTDNSRPPDTPVLVGVSDPRSLIQKVQFGMPRESEVRILVFDVSGRRVEELVRGVREAGFHEVHWNSSGQPNGLYFLRMEIPQGVVTQKVVLAR